MLSKKRKTLRLKTTVGNFSFFRCKFNFETGWSQTTVEFFDKWRAILNIVFESAHVFQKWRTFLKVQNSLSEKWNCTVTLTMGHRKPGDLLFEAPWQKDTLPWWEQFGYAHPDEFLASDDGAGAGAKSQKKKRKGEQQPRAKRVKKDYWAGPWLTMLKDPNLQIPGSRSERLFRRRFRVPYPMFNELLLDLRNDPAENWERYDATGRKDALVPLELYLLCALRVLGRGEVFDTIAELSMVGETSIRVFFHKYTSL